MKSHKKLTAVLTVTLALSLGLAALSPATALFGRAEEAPGVAAFAKSAAAGGLVSFSEEDFAARLTGTEALDAIVVASLPEGGALRLAGRVLGRGEVVARAELQNLCYVPDAETQEVYTSFQFVPVFAKTGAGEQSVTVSINLSDTTNMSPIAQDLSYETYAGVKLCAPLKCTDIDGDPCTFQIVTQGKKGTVEVSDSAFVYSPLAGKTGRDSFTYTATDARGNVSAPATVTVELCKRAQKDTFQYTDMQDSQAHYAALRLREQGVFVGETIGQEHFFYPGQAVSRAEFVALVAAVTELGLPTMAVGTGLSDNADIPVWAQPYVAAAVHTGIVTGEAQETGNKIFRAADAITRAEAAAIVNRSLALVSDGRGLQFEDSGNVPAWAHQAVINTTYAGILPVFGDNTVRANAVLTREACAQMVWEMIAHLESGRSSGGLLGLFG